MKGLTGVPVLMLLLGLTGRGIQVGATVHVGDHVIALRPYSWFSSRPTAPGAQAIAIVPGMTNTILLSGVVADPGGAGIPDATIDLLYLASPSAASYSYLLVTTDSSGHYTATFDAVPDAIDGGVAFAGIGKAGYEGQYHYIMIDTQTAEYDVTMRPGPIQISTGQTIEVTVAANDSICNNNLQDTHPWPLEYEWVCRAIQVISPTAGTLTVQVLPNAGTTSGAQLEVETADGDIVRGFALTQSVPVQAGQLVGVELEIPYGSGNDRTFTLVTSMGGNTGPYTNHLGCFTDGPNRALPVFAASTLSMTPDVCKSQCAGYPYAGVQWSIECWCGTTLGYDQVSASECNLPCSGDASVSCGAGYHNDIYSTFNSHVEIERDAVQYATGPRGCPGGPLDCGGAYYDRSPGNWGDYQARTDDVDLFDDDNGVVIGGTEDGEWVTFVVDVPQPGTYTVEFRTASPSWRTVTPTINVGVWTGSSATWTQNQIVPNTGDWHTYTSWFSTTNVTLPAGTQTMTVWFGGGWINLRSIRWILQ